MRTLTKTEEKEIDRIVDEAWESLEKTVHEMNAYNHSLSYFLLKNGVFNYSKTQTLKKLIIWLVVRIKKLPI